MIENMLSVSDEANALRDLAIRINNVSEVYKTLSERRDRLMTARYTRGIVTLMGGIRTDAEIKLSFLPEELLTICIRHIEKDMEKTRDTIVSLSNQMNAMVSPSGQTGP